MLLDGEQGECDEEEAEEARQSFMAEARVLAALHHDRVVAFRGISTFRGRMAMVTEFCEGGSLGNALHPGRLHGELPLHRGERPAWVHGAATLRATLPALCLDYAEFLL